jgi:DNA-binding GntR family transcriptional regulator
MTITRSTPVAVQVNQILRERIRLGVYPPGSKLPSESELSQEFDVSRATIRTVLARIAAEGLILRKQGDGTYINEHIRDVNTHLGGLWEFSRLIENSGYQPSIHSLSIIRRASTEYEAHLLDILPGDEVLELKRLFYADKDPVILATNIIPLARIDPSAGEPDGRLPIHEFIQRYCHRKIAYAVSDVLASVADNEVARILNWKEKDPLLKIEITFYDRDNSPLLCGHSYLNDTILRLRLVQAWE